MPQQFQHRLESLDAPWAVSLMGLQGEVCCWCPIPSSICKGVETDEGGHCFPPDPSYPGHRHVATVSPMFKVGFFHKHLTCLLLKTAAATCHGYLLIL